jgi:hypothetical protein
MPPEPWGRELVASLARVCQLQPVYTPSNTEAMRERGRLIRGALPDLLRDLGPELSAELGPFGEGFDVGASDGIGRKTEAPWVRIFAREMSPAPTNGFYVVLHFAADGSAMFVTIGCGSTIWANGDLRAVSDGELRQRTDWARGVIVEAFGDLEPFTDQIVLGAKASLPRTFEKATVAARRVATSDLDAQVVTDLILKATRRLRQLYEAQSLGRLMTPPDMVELHLEGLSRPEREAGGGGQGFGLSGPERKAVELRAMTVARAWLEVEGYVVKDTSRVSAFDFQATRDGAILKVEVKGTTSDAPAAIFMTRNEVELHRREAGATALMIVSKIRLDRKTDPPTASGGELTAEIGWDIDSWELAPLAFRLSRKSIAG